MRNTPLERLSQARPHNAVSCFVADHLAWIIAGTGLAATAAINGCGKIDLTHSVPAAIKAQDLDTDIDDIKPVSALKPENASMSTVADAVVVQPVSFVSVAPEKVAGVQKQPLTIDQLPEGVNLLDTPIMIRSGNEKFVLTVKDNGATLQVQEIGSDKPIKLCNQKALGRGTILGFKKEMGPYDIRWPDVQVVTGDEKDDAGNIVRKNVKLFSIRGQQKGEKIQDAKEKPESKIADLCLNLARNGVVSYKVDPVLGFDVTVTASEKKE